MSKKSTIRLPVQTLNWSLVKKPDKLWKIFFQFDVHADHSGRKTFSLVAYPAYKNGSKCTIGPRISLKNKKNSKVHELKLPLTLGNLEMKHSDMKKTFSLTGKTQLLFTPHFYHANPHADYLVSDGTSTLTANPSPPAKPAS